MSMKKAMVIVVAWWGLAWMAGVTHAAPLATYRFNVSEMNCIERPGVLPTSSDPGCQDERDFFTSKLQTISFQAPLDATVDRFSLLVDTLYYGPGSVFPQAAAINSMSGLDLSAWGVPPGLDEGLCLVSFRCQVEASFERTGDALGGLFRLGTLFDDIFMASDASLLWSGYIDSDGPIQTGGAGGRPTFTGQWLRVAEVPEPGTLALLLLPVGALVLRQRRHPRTQKA